MPLRLAEHHARGIVDALERFKVSSEELRLKIPARSFHGFEAAKKVVAKKAGDGMSADGLAQIFETIQPPKTPGDATQPKDQLDRTPAWGAPSNPAGGDAGTKGTNMATTQLNPSEISELIKTRIEKVKLAAEARNEGTVTSVSDGIVRIHGLADVMQGEMIELPNATYALALNLERDSVGAVVLGDYEHLREGDEILLDATQGIANIRPGPAVIEAFEARSAVNRE